MVNEIYLTEVRRRPSERILALTWSDGHSADFDYDYLRGFCPCAMCQGHAASAIRFRAPARPADLTTIEPVGNYGISLAWSDGHATGIYRFDFLKTLCPCTECASARDGELTEVER